MNNTPFHNIPRAVILSVLAAIFFSLMAVFVKIAAEHTTNNVIILFRFSISLLYVFVVFGFRRLHHHPVNIKTHHFGLHMLRAICALGGILIFYYVLAYIPLLDASLLFTTYPLFVPILAAIFMNIRTPKSIWVTTIIGFVGVAFVLQPGLGMFKHVMSLLALLSGFLIAISSLTLRKICKHDDLYTVMFYYFSLSLLVSGIISIFNWKTPSPYLLFILILIGITGTLYQEFITQAAKYAPARIVTTLMFLSVALSGIFDWLIWKHIPNLYCAIGIGLVLTSALFTIIFAFKKDLYQRIR